MGSTVTALNFLALSFALLLPPPVTRSVERAFLQNSPEVLRGALSPSGGIPVSLPDPVSFADQLSSDQVYLLFKQIFRVFKTMEFYVNPVIFSLPGKPGGILRARWSIRNERTGMQYPFRVFFFVLPEAVSGSKATVALRVVEIRAEKL